MFAEERRELKKKIKFIFIHLFIVDNWKLIKFRNND